MRHFTDVGPGSGTIRWRDGHAAVGVLQAPDNHSPIGMAPGTGWDDQGRLVYRLIVHGADVPGRWVVVDREFRPRHGASGIGHDG